MPQAGRFPTEIGEDGLTLLKLAEKLPANAFLALQRTAASALHIIATTAKFKVNREEWTRCGRLIENAVAAAIQSLYTQYSTEAVEATEGRIQQLLETLETIKTEIHTSLGASLFTQRRSLSGDRQLIASFKTLIGAALSAFQLSIPETFTETHPGRLLDIIVNGYNDALNGEGSLVQNVTVFNTNSTSGGSVTNVAGDYNVYISDNAQSGMKVVLDKLPYSEGASWDIDLACLPGTRANILSTILLWSRSLDHQNVFWLNGVAGSGKSAIAHTVAQMLQKDGLLGSSFFFNREFDSRNTSQMLVSTIARDIAARYPAMAMDISTALESEPALASASLSRQFEAFIAQPLRRHKFDHPIVVVIDALDEVIQDDSGVPLLAMLRDKVAELAPQLRMLITSRPTMNIRLYLSAEEHVMSHTIAIDSVENREDIEVYVDDQLRDKVIASRMGSPWPDEALVRDLKFLADGLFIWIVTVFNYLRNVHKPRAKLRALLSKSKLKGVLGPHKKMDALYTVVLEICGDWEDPDFCEDYVIFMGAIMAAKRPLSLGALRALYGETQELSPEHLLQRFGAVLVGLHGDNETIRILHLSFREFITDRADNSQLTRKFHISEKAHSQRLAKLCLQTMVSEITFAGISGAGYLLKHSNDGPGIPEVTGVSEQLLYGCEYWIDHISDVEDRDIAICEVLREFLTYHNTFWIEIVSSRSVFRGSMAVWRWLEVHAPELKVLHCIELHADTLRSLSNRLSYASRHKEALTAIQESVFMLRKLSSERPAAFNADLAASLNNLSKCLSNFGRQDEALAAIQETVVLHRALASERPAVLNADLARSLNNLSNHLSNLGRQNEALAAIQEAVILHRALASERPAVFNAYLARSLNNLSNHLSDLGQREEAMVVIQEAVSLRRVLAVERPAAFNADLAESLNNLSNCLFNLGRQDEALAVIQEAVGLRRVLVAERPAVFNADLAASLNNLSNCLFHLGWQDEALAVIQEAVVLRRVLAADRPAVFNADLAMSLSNLSCALSNHGRQEEAMTVILEAVILRRVLAADRPAAFNADLAMSLNNLSCVLSIHGRQEEATTVILEAVILRRVLAADRPALHNASLRASLQWLCICLLKDGREQEAEVISRELADLQ